jgi:hypothetical protein
MKYPGRHVRQFETEVQVSHGDIHGEQVLVVESGKNVGGQVVSQVDPYR